MRYLAPGLLLVALGGLLILRGFAADKPTVVAKPTAAVILVHDERGKLVGIHRLADAKQVTAIESFFPAYQDRPTSRTAGGWRFGYQVYFDSGDGRSARLSVSSPSKESAVWSLGEGDFPVKGDFHKFVSDLGPPTTGGPAAPAPAWADPQNGLTGRLLVVPEELKPGRRHAVSLELKNESAQPLAVIDQPRLEVELSAGGKPIPDELQRMSGPIPKPQWGVVPQSAALAFRVDMRTVGVPTNGPALLAVGGKMWRLEPGTYELRAVLVAEKRKDGPDNQWVGRLPLPPVEVVVAKAQVPAK